MKISSSPVTGEEPDTWRIKVRKRSCLALFARSENEDTSSVLRRRR
jgi:hypothetical protein